MLAEVEPMNRGSDGLARENSIPINGGCILTRLLIDPGYTPPCQIKNLVKVKVQVQVMGYPLLMPPAYVCYHPQT